MEIDICIMIRSIGRGGVIDYMCLQMSSPSCGGAGRRRTSGDMRHQLSESQRIRLLPVFQLSGSALAAEMPAPHIPHVEDAAVMEKVGAQYDYALPATRRIEAINDNIPHLGWPDGWNLQCDRRWVQLLACSCLDGFIQTQLRPRAHMLAVQAARQAGARISSPRPR